jgi:pimeloyl-ACP methyl ester carboxylesterase
MHRYGQPPDPRPENGFRAVAYDRRGHGRSDDPGAGYEFDALADDLAALLDGLDLTRVTLSGIPWAAVSSRVT